MRSAKPLLLAFALCWGPLVHADVAVPALTGHVTDQTATFTPNQLATLEQELQAFEATKGSQLAILLVATTAPESIEQYSLRVAEKWKLGRKKVDDGAILVVAKNDRSVRIEVGYGLEGALNDAISERIISETITPQFKAGDFYGGISAGVDQIIRTVNGEPLPAPTANPAVLTSDISRYIPILFILALVVGGVLKRVFGRLPGSIVTGGAVAVLAWFFAGTVVTAILAGAIALFFTLLGGSMLGPGVAGMLGGFGGGRRGGGGFGGGGGGFGGGGASGRW